MTLPETAPSGRDGGAEKETAERQRAEHDRRETIRLRDSFYRRTLGVADALSIAMALDIGLELIAGADLRPAAALMVPLFVVAAKILGLYDRDEYLLHKTTLDEVPALFNLATLSALLIFLASGAIANQQLTSSDILVFWALLFPLLVVNRAAARQLSSRLTPPERCLFVGDEGSAEQFAAKLAASHSVRAELVDRLSVEPRGVVIGQADRLPTLERLVAEKSLDRVVLAPGVGLEGGDSLMHVISELKTYGVKVSIMAAISRVAGSSVELDHLDGITLLGMRRFEISHSSLLIKRTFDIVGATLALIVLAPLMALIAIGIRLDSRGPALFRQRRVGRNGEELEMLKFRSMVSEAESRKDELRHLNEGAEGLFKIADDPRLTRVGKLIRRWSLDELPQLFHVLSAKMSLVGPRPLVPEEDARIEGWYRDRLAITPGMTGYWQALGSARIPLDEMVRLDYLYLANWSLWNDVRILLRTMGFVFGRRGL